MFLCLSEILSWDRRFLFMNFFQYIIKFFQGKVFSQNFMQMMGNSSAFTVFSACRILAAGGSAEHTAKHSSPCTQKIGGKKVHVEAFDPMVYPH